MPRPRSQITLAAIEDTAEKLLAVGTQMSQVAIQLKQAGMTEALLPWTNAHWRAVDKLVEAGLPLMASTLTEVNAFKSGRKSTAAMEQQRSMRDYAKRKERRAEESPNEEKRPRGRPKKKS